jgi:hypothetical protein
VQSTGLESQGALHCFQQRYILGNIIVLVPNSFGDRDWRKPSKQNLTGAVLEA